MKKFKKSILVMLVLALGLTAAECDESRDARSKDEAVSEQILADLQRAHPVPQFRRSQLRQNLVELTTAQAETTQTTTFFFNLGVERPISSCPSIGFPIPATMQLTNPEQIAKSYSGGYAILPQVEPTGVFTGDTTGTYVMCVDARGNAYAVYWEGFTQTLTGPAEYRDGQGVELIGPPSFEFTTEEGDAVIDEDDPDFVEETEEPATVEDEE